MGIGVTINYSSYPQQAVSLQQKLAEPGVVSLDWIEATGVVPLIQGDQMAVAPMADSSTGFLAPPIPGGLQLEKVVVPIAPTMPMPVDLPHLLDAWSRLHEFLNFTMPSEGYL